jgi:hypothetical protein
MIAMGSWYLLAPVGHFGRIIKTYGNVEHKHVVENQMQGEYSGHNRLGELEPRYSQFRHAEKEGEINEDPFKKKEPRRISILNHLKPVVKLPCPQQDVDTESVETLLRSVENGQRNDRLANGGLRSSTLRRERQRRRSCC